ncbi:hypothetical protein [Streptomyces sp. NPDC056061]|uniref:hypothetical protein n=1 Tax=Streptomyces sp. NPDC056061 TaxID=3345700 RepID=UPI0035D5FCA3
MRGLAAAAFGASVTGLIYLTTQQEIAVVLGRNTAGYIGITLLLAPFTGYRVAAASTAFVPLLCAATGWAPGGQPERWAWILHDEGAGVLPKSEVDLYAAIRGNGRQDLTNRALQRK